jgi:DNA invertase Pin-like site-specific DNA recombinase
MNWRTGMEDRPGWGIYLRISRAKRKDKDGKTVTETLGIERQEPPCRELVARKGGQVIEVYQDNDKSAFKGDRDDFERMLIDARAGVIKGIAAWDIDRLTRNPDRDIPRIIELAENYGVQLAVVTGEVDPSTSSGRMMLRIAGALARRESEHRAERLLAKFEELAHAGKPHGGERCFGYERDGMTINQDEAKLIKEARKRLFAGESTAKILQDWTKRGVVGVRGRPMNATSFKRIMTRPRTAGLRQHGGEIIGDAKWKRIISPNDRMRLLAILNDPERDHSGPQHKYVFSGVLECSHCKAPMVGNSKGKGLPMYGCPHKRQGGCHRTFVAAPAVEAYLVPIVMDLLDSREVWKELRARQGDSKREDALWSQLQDDERELEELASLKGKRNPDTGRPYFTMREWLAAKAPIEQRITQANEALKQVTRSRSGVLALPVSETGLGAWMKGDLETRRMLVKAVLDKVTIKPGRRGGPGFDSTRAEVIPQKALTTKAGTRKVVEAILAAHQANNGG